MGYLPGIDNPNFNEQITHAEGLMNLKKKVDQKERELKVW